MDLDLSFVLPVYNVEAYLPQCLDSMLSQMGDSCEIILVDDGTPDHSGRICDEYAERDSRVHVLHKENGGPSSARNAGAALAKGKYICFVDSDDYIEENSVPELLKWIREVQGDLCFLQAKKVYPDGSSEPVREDIRSEGVRGKTKDQILTYLASRNTFPGGPWAKLYRRAFLEENGIRFPEGVISEDLIYCLNVYLAAETVDCLDGPFYCYRQGRKGSLTSVVTPKYFFDTFLFIEEVAQRFGRDRKPQNAREELALSAAGFEYAILVWQARDLQGEDSVRAYEKLKEYRWVLPWGRSSKARLIYWASVVLGLKNAGRLVGVYQKLRG